MSDPVSIAIAETQFDIVKDEQLQQNALNVGHHMMSKLRLLKDKHNCIKDVRYVFESCDSHVIYPIVFQRSWTFYWHSNSRFQRST